MGPKLYLREENQYQEALSKFAADISRPALIVGNGPSAAQPEYDLIPENPFIFRMNWFFFEDHYYYGSQADAYLWSIHNQGLHEKLADVVRSGEYQFRSFLCPMRVGVDTREQGYSPLSASLSPQYDHWAIISTHPLLARNFMGRPLPTQGFQALACALCLGFREIYLAGIDLYQSTVSRYSYSLPDEAKKHLSAKDVSAGYEDKHSLSRDLHFLETCLAAFPDARVRTVTASPLVEKIVGRSSGTRASVNSSLFRPKRKLEWLDSDTPQASSALPEQDPRWHKEINGKRCAYVTLVTGDFYHGARALRNSIARVSDVPLIAITTELSIQAELEKSDIRVMRVPRIQNPNRLVANNERFADTYTKLSVFNLTQWDRIVFIDSDAIVLDSVDDLFEIDEFAAAPDLGIELNYEKFNSGVLCLQPDSQVFRSMLESLDRLDSYDGGDQGFLNEFFPEHRRLDRKYNVLKRLTHHHPNLFNLEETKILHFVGEKPWRFYPYRLSEYRDLEVLWLNYLSREELVDLLDFGRTVDIPRLAKRSNAFSNSDAEKKLTARCAKAEDNLKSEREDRRVLIEKLEHRITYLQRRLEKKNYYVEKLRNWCCNGLGRSMLFRATVRRAVREFSEWNHRNPPPK